MRCLSALLAIGALFATVTTSHGNSTPRGSIANMYDIWDSVVSRYVQPGTMENISLNVVDYEGISKDANYTAFLNAISTVNTTSLESQGHDAVYAFFMNVYNVLAIKMIIDHPCSSSIFHKKSCQPIKSIKDIGSLLHPVWNFPAGEVGGKQWSLNDVEDYLRKPQPLKEDSRVHACIVCASISCPNVRREAFRPEKIGAQMDDQVRDMLQNPKKGLYLDRSSNTLHLSSIFLWFAGDFAQYGGVTKFVSQYIPADDAQYIAQKQPSLKYFDYDWNVNGKPPCKCNQ